jgi:hypothetical protein
MHFPFVRVEEIVAVGEMPAVRETHVTLGPLHRLARPAMLGGFTDHREPIVYVVGNSGRLSRH